jgi:pimeloyl-ACP methyl ester carboxylesterase
MLRAVAANRALDLGRVITLGHSAGGHLALWLAARHRLPVGALGDGDAAVLTGPDVLPLVGAISQAGVVDLTAGWQRKLGNGAVSDFIGGGADMFPERYAIADPALSLPLGIPQVLVHGLRDDIVPPIISELYLAAATRAGDDVRLRAIPDADHMAVIDPTTPAWAVIIEEVQRLLRIG